MSRFYAKALHGGHDGLPTLKKRDVVFAAGNGPEALLGAWMGWARWGMEEHGKEIDHLGFVGQFMDKTRSGNFLQIIGWDGGEPVAMVELRVLYDALLHRYTCYGDHAYVHPDYRRRGVMTALVDYCIATATLMELKHWVVPVTAGEEASAPWLKSVYEAAGFRTTGLTMAREVA